MKFRCGSCSLVELLVSSLLSVFTMQVKIERLAGSLVCKQRNSLFTVWIFLFQTQSHQSGCGCVWCISCLLTQADTTRFQVNKWTLIWIILPEVRLMRVKKFTLQDTKDLFIYRHKSVQDHDPVKPSDYFHLSRWNVFTFHKSCFISWRNWLWVITGYCLFLYHDTDYRWPLFFLMLVIKKIICEVKPKTLHLKRGDVSRPFLAEWNRNVSC